MAVNFTDAPSATRVNLYLLDPREITIKPELNGRHELPPIDDIIQGFLDIGQTTPVLIGRDGGSPVLYAGHRRWRAAIEITKKKLLPKTDKNPDQVFKLRCSFFEGDERTAFLATISENHDRESATPIDDAHNIVKLRRWEYSDEDIAGVYHKKTSDGKPDVIWVRNRASLIALCDEAVEALKDGRMKPTAAVAIAKLAKDAQRQRIKQSDGQKRITGKSVAPVQKPAESVDPNVKAAVTEMERILSTKVRVIEGAKGKGKIEIEYYSADDLSRIYDLVAEIEKESGTGMEMPKGPVSIAV